MTPPGRRADLARLGRTVHVDYLTLLTDTGTSAHEPSRGRPHHRRRWSLADDGLRIDDLVTGRGRHEIVVRWHLSAGAIAEVTDRTAVVTSAAGSFLMTVKATTAVALGVETRPVTTGSAGIADAPVLTCRMNADLPARVTSSWSRARGDDAGEMT